MLTGRVAFAGETVSDTIAKIIERDPTGRPSLQQHPLAFDGSCSAALRRIRAALRDIAEARIAIDTIDDVLPGDADAAVARPALANTLAKSLPWVALACSRPVSLRGKCGGRRSRRKICLPTRSSHVSRTGRARKGRPDFARREVRRLPRRSRGSVRHLAQPGGHRGF